MPALVPAPAPPEEGGAASSGDRITTLVPDLALLALLLPFSRSSSSRQRSLPARWPLLGHRTTLLVLSLDFGHLDREVLLCLCLLS